MENIQDIIDKIYERVEAHKISDGVYSRWLWQDETGNRELGTNAYGCADAANLLYTISCFPRHDDDRAAWIDTMQAMQDKESGLFYESTHHPIHTTAHVAAALELFDASPEYRPSEMLQYLDAERFNSFMESLEWNAPWNASHQGAGLYVILNLCNEATPEWNDLYFKWLWDNTDPVSGFWRKGEVGKKGNAPLYHYMASAFHYFFNHESAHMPVRYPDRMIDSCIQMYRDNALQKTFPCQMSFTEVDITYCLSRASRQTPHRFDEVKDVLRDLASRYISYLRSLDWETDDGVNDLHLLFGSACALAELQSALPGELRTDKPLKLVLDRRPFI